MKHPLCALVIGLGLVLAGTVHASDTSKINGDVEVAAGQQVGDVETVNGDIRIADRANVDSAETVNGRITLGSHASAESLETVNGDLTLKPAARVRGDAETVNGDIELGQGAEVGGEVSNVSGSITLDDAHVAGGLETVAGDIEVGAGSRVEGGILVDKPHGNWFRGNQRTPRIVIGPDAVVQGTLEFRRKVDLYVSDRATIGPVKGATAQRFSGDQP